MSARVGGRWWLLAGAVVSEVAATVSLKGALDHPALYVVVVTGYTAAFGFLAGVLRAGMGLGVAYGIWAATGVAATAVMSTLLFDEPFTPVMALGLGVIVIGVLTVELGSQRAHRRLDEVA